MRRCKVVAHVACLGPCFEEGSLLLSLEYGYFVDYLKRSL